MTDIAKVFDATQQALRAVGGTDGSLPPLNEAETRAHLIDPVVIALGYTTLDQVRREYRLQASGQVVDYLLAAGEQHVVIEAKSCGAALTSRDAAQLVGYCAQEGIRWSLLTNGISWQVFDVEVRGNWEAKQVAELDLLGAQRAERLGEAVTVLNKFARELLVGGDLEVQRWAQAERARAVLERLVSEPGSPVVQSVMNAMAERGIDLESDDVIALLKASTQPESRPSLTVQDERPTPPARRETPVKYYLFPAAPFEGIDAVEHLRAWLNSGRWGVRQSTPHRKRMQAGDRCCFYAKSVGIVAKARIDGPADRTVPSDDWPIGSFAPDVYAVPINEIQWLDAPLAIDADLRAELDAFADKDAAGIWSWFVQTTNGLTEHDFLLLTRAETA